MSFSSRELDFVVNELPFDKQLLFVLKSEPERSFSIEDIARVLDVDCVASQNRVKFYSTLEDITYRQFITKDKTAKNTLYRITSLVL